MKILVIKMSALGDVIHALPVIPALKRRFAGARVHWLVEETAEPIVRAHPGVDRVLVSRRRLWGEAPRTPRRWPLLFKEALALVRQLRGQRYDLALDLQGLLKSGIWTRLSAARRRVGFRSGREYSYLLLNERVPSEDPELHAVERYLRLAAAVGATTTEVDFGLSPSQEARVELQKMLKDLGWKTPSPYAVVAPTARWETKQWTEPPLARLADRLSRDFGLQVAFTGVAEDRPLVGRVMGSMSRPAFNLAGKTDLSMLTALLHEAEVVISVDSAPMHLAAALGTPVVGIFGPTAPWRTGPFGKGHRVLRSQIQCSPCYRRRCCQRTCMVDIQPEEVIEAVAKVMNQDSGIGVQQTTELGCRVRGTVG